MQTQCDVSCYKEIFVWFFIFLIYSNTEAATTGVTVDVSGEGHRTSQISIIFFPCARAHKKGNVVRYTDDSYQ